MTKTLKRILASVMTLAFAINAGTALASTAFAEEELPTAEEIITDAIQTSTDDIAEYNGDITDENGKMIVPFDVAYPEAFASGDFAYDKTALLIKMSEEFEGTLTESLSACGAAAIEYVSPAVDGKWYRISLADGTDIAKAITALRALDEVLMADYDYQVESEAVEETQVEVTPVMAAQSDAWWDEDVAGNPRISEQWYLNSCNLQETWDFLESKGINPGGSASVTVAVIDTGVDYTHPDLAASMWVNKSEIPGNGIDDDGNGYKDDIYGYSTIGSTYDHKGDPMDDHGHGTHVAGIIGAANNKEGIVGVAYGVKIMAVKAGQATGVFNQSDIAEAIIYAYENGADVINMSFGSSACSLAVQDALEIAATRATLVAAAGNDGRPNYDTFYYTGMPCYPAALFYVIGVMSSSQSGIESSFTNWDANIDAYNVYAPGERMLSTLPGGKYGYLNGTSMAAPVVAAIAALLRSYYVDRDMYPAKFITGQIVSTSESYASCVDPEHHKLKDPITGNIGPTHFTTVIIDAYLAMTKMPKPDIQLYDYYLFDDESLSEKNNGDGVIDSGETVNIGAILYNRWGMSKDTVVTIDAIGDNGIANPYVEIINGTSNFEGVGTCSTKDQLIKDENGLITGVDEPLILKISADCPNDYQIVLNVTITCKNGLDQDDIDTYSTYYTMEFWVRKGVLLPSQFTEDTTLTNSNYYILSNMCYIPEGVTITVEPGTHIQFWDDGSKDPYANEKVAKLIVEGNFIVNGTEEEIVQLFPSEAGDLWKFAVEIRKQDNGYVELNYCKVLNPLVDADKIRNSILQGNNYHTVSIKKLWNNGTSYVTNTSTTILAPQIENSKLEYIFYLNSSSDYFNNKSISGVVYNSNFNQVYCSRISAKKSSFVSCYFQNVSYFDQCLFANCNAYSNAWPTIQNSVIISSEFRIGTSDITYSKHTTDTTTGVTYVELKYRGGSLSFAGNAIDQLRELAALIGGHLVCIETQEEYNYLKNNFSLEGKLVGVEYGCDKWDNGEPVGDWISLYSSRSYYAQINVPHLSYLIDNAQENGILIEIPAENISLANQNSIFSAIEKWVQAGNRNIEFNNNVVLSNFNSASSNWSKIICNNYNNDDQAIGFSGVYWGTTDTELIEKQIIDFLDFPDPTQYGIANITGFLTEAPSDTMPFVVDAYLLNQDGERVRTVNNETVTFVVEFNRDMDTDVPLKVTFGSSAEYFYEDYNLSEHGKWVAPRRWEATYTLKTVIENGNHTIKVENAQAADDEWLKLYDVPGRFMFEIDTTAAQALIMQGTATETGIQLNWMQDDFDVLMGYNVYRSTSENGYYQRLNTSVIPYDTKEFFDDTVEPGKVYYYNFTVVKTDLTESEPSGKISLMSMDTMAPNIYHSPVRSGFVGTNIVVGATITDNLMIRSAALYWRVIGEIDWHRSDMTALNSSYTGVIYGNSVTLSGVEYYIEAFDGVSHTYKGSAENPYQISVQQAVDASSLGDVDGDGIITSKDALMLMQAANDLLNLTEEQFLRADINKDKELSAAEALRILQYVSGKITTITG